MFLRFIINHSRQLAVVLLQLFALLVYVQFVEGHICEIGREKDETGTWMWVLPYDKPCLCSKIVMGGINTWTPIRPFKPIYVKNPLLSNNTGEIRKHYQLICGNTNEHPAEASTSTSRTASKKTATTRKERGSTKELISLSVSEKATSMTKEERGSTKTLMSRSAPEKATTMPVTAKKERGSTKELMSLSVSEKATTMTATTKEECDDAGRLGMETGGIINVQLTASSHYTEHGAWEGRLNNDNNWATSHEPSEEGTLWIQVDLLRQTIVTGVITQGSAYIEKEWVKNLQIQYGDTLDTLTYISDNSTRRTFLANTDQDTPVTITFPELITTCLLRIIPISWHAWCAIRFEVLGCFKDCSTSLGMASGKILDSKITASLFHQHLDWDRLPQYARLGYGRTWASAGGDTEPWIQVDLGRSHMVTGLLTTGSPGKYWVERMKVQVGMVAESLEYIVGINGQHKVFEANKDPNNIVKITLNETGLMAQFVRIIPTNCVRNVGGNVSPDLCVVQFEILGCS